LTVVRNKEWDKAATLDRAAQRLSANTGAKWRVYIHGNHADLWVHRKQITKGMTIAEARAFVEGMILSI